MWRREMKQPIMPGRPEDGSEAKLKLRGGNVMQPEVGANLASAGRSAGGGRAERDNEVPCLGGLRERMGGEVKRACPADERSEVGGCVAQRNPTKAI